jgi:putative SOS response-associated peptidase YedK
MCGRYVSVASRADLQTLYEISRPGQELRPSYNVAPSQQIYGVLERHDKDGPAVERQLRQLRTLKWGLVPSWAKDTKLGSRLINARAETLDSKPSWRAAFAKRRVILPAAGYYEWQPAEVDGEVGKQPYYIHPAGGGVLSFAGLYEL